VRRLPSSGAGFLRLERFRARNLYAGGGVSPPYRFEVLHRRTVDAVAIIPFFRRGGGLWIVLKEGFRPGLYLRRRLRLAVRDRRSYTLFREAVAGSLEPGDRGERGIDRRARAELLEETGLSPAGGRVLRLGSGFFPSHGQSTEKVHLRAVRVDPGSGVRPSGDGSINEGDSGTLVMEAKDILRACRSGRIEDPKLEIGVTRLCRRLGYRVH
jgi:8-oxo-dGTP pyrophosphatase MutT (NUDIX family)